MKRILCLALCLCMTMLCLVGCADEDIGAFLENYPKVEQGVKEMTLTVCVITDDTTTELSKDTVSQHLSQYSKDAFNTNLVVEYMSSVDYENKILEKTAPTAEKKPDIILVNSSDMLERLVEMNRVADLTEYFEGETYGKLNVSISGSILEAAKIKNKLYCVPNNHVVGEYEYLVISKAVARDFYYSDSAIKAMHTYEDTKPLRDKMTAPGSKYEGEDVSTYIRVIKGGYEVYASGMDSLDDHYNIMTYPQVDKSEALASSFAVVNGTEDVNRCMQIIYALNTDETFRNTLQYGVDGTNYKFDKDSGVVTRHITGDYVYLMDITHTGNVFLAYPYKDGAGHEKWSKKDIEYGKIQNYESVAANSSN